MSNEFVLMGFYVFILIYSIILHEVSHGWVALWLGDVTAKYAGRLSLHPKSHIDPFGSILVPIVLLLVSGGKLAFGWAKPVPYNPDNLKDKKKGELFVALSGPATNIALAFGAIILSYFIDLSSVTKAEMISHLNDWGKIAQMLSGSFESIFFILLVYIVFWNVVLAFFNLIPIPPLDGSKILYAIFPLDIKTKMFLEQYGFVLLLFIIVFMGTVINSILSWALNLFFGMMV